MKARSYDISIRVYLRAAEDADLPDKKEVEDCISTVLLDMPRLGERGVVWDVLATSLPEFAIVPRGKMLLTRKQLDESQADFEGFVQSLHDDLVGRIMREHEMRVEALFGHVVDKSRSL